MESFLDDVRLLFSNAKLFYPRGSEEYCSTVELERAFTRKLVDCGCGVGGHGEDERPSSPSSLTLKIPKCHLITPPTSSGKSRKASVSSESSQPSSSLRRHSLSQVYTTAKTGTHSAHKAGQSGSKTGSAGRPPLRLKVTRSRAWVQEYANSEDPVKIFMASVYDYHDPAGSYVAEIFHELPSRQDYPEYYRVITEPLDLNMIRKNTEVVLSLTKWVGCCCRGFILEWGGGMFDLSL